MVGLCRLCASLKKADLLINITDESNELCQKLQKCCQVNISMCDALPKSVCQSCLDQLNVSYNFFSNVHEAQETLKALFPSKEAEESTNEVQGSVDDSQPKDISARRSKQSQPKEIKEIIDHTRRQKRSLQKIKIENGDVETQETIQSINTNLLANKCDDNVSDPGDNISIKDTTTSNTLKQSTTTKKDEIRQPVKRQKKSHHNIKSEKIDVEHSKRETDTRNIVFTIANEETNNADNDGYLQEVYNILGMSHGVVDQGPTPEEHERMDSLVTTYGKDDQDHVLTQEEHFFLDGDEQNLMVDEDLLEQEQNIKVFEDTDCNMELEEIVYDESYADEEIELDYEELEEDISQNANDFTDIGYNKKGAEDKEKYYSSLPSELQLTSWRSYKHLCYACNYSSFSLEELIRHARVTHSISDKNKLHYRCYDCTKVLEHYNDFLNHVRLKHHPALKLRCDACDMLCTDYRQHQLHRDFKCLEAKKFPNNLTCSYCCKTFRSSAGKQMHIKQHMESKQSTNKFECKMCPKEFLSKIALNLHEKIHKTNIATFSCDQCEKLFINKVALDAHMSTHMNRRLYTCTICQKDFKTQAYLEKHQFIHTDQRPFRCSFCPRQFRTKIEQTTHERVHTGEMPLQCVHCEKRFRFRSALSAHLKTHSGIRSHTCKYCSRQFNDISNFKKHVRRKHPEEEGNEGMGDVEKIEIRI